MSLRLEYLEELRIILFEMFAVHLKIVYAYYIVFLISLLEEIKIPILSYPILPIK